MVFRNEDSKMSTIVPVLAVSVVVLITALSAMIIYFICPRPQCPTVSSPFCRLDQVQTVSQLYFLVLINLEKKIY